MRRIYGFAPHWVPLFFSNYQLAPWHGGCAWIFQLNDNTPYAAFLQLRSAFRTQKRYLGMYERTELIAHEMAHIGRMMFEEPEFEEIIAFQSSTNRFRRFFGPLFRSSKESMLFVIVLGLSPARGSRAASAPRPATRSRGRRGCARRRTPRTARRTRCAGRATAGSRRRAPCRARRSP